MPYDLRIFARTAAPACANEPIHVRLLTHRDLSALLELEHEKWDVDQAASQDALRARIDAYPDLAMGAFCTSTGRLLASLFLRPVPDDFHRTATTWRACASLPVPRRSTTLFGISLSSRSQPAVDALLRFYWPRALRQGWRRIYLGSPIPGLREWLQGHPADSVRRYARATRSGRPVDPQLRYYRARGFNKIVAIKPGYFPHERSLDYGVLLRGTIPLSSLAPLWARLPPAVVQRITQALAGLL
ncbi:hypothetical protein WKR88_15260 [Trinickia caryophylli]|uniref:N-acetyltransferase domain-containing protein n=1 Tax=Trinickia caryophylli TaxID=28094 RepID=A0A1X7D5T9_TRICW|nr:hypothetical protein [Trinickia caryophylli]PMS12700.1 hypothetical protein C0Z17_07660 [Trinickia caryophylli]TRX15107.1 hypothetical protein FNF07_28335 [Trinickia caryophylli]WQE14966.1 hypothetical protein U0034_20655 [Trinickia caryophylli]SMF09407.1 hypothetical protein SAMN06295900_102431 [Trinickia caryophylli]GLU31304.1 hypothetical protein Busp01_11460 [Trinickia caryophylli]